MKKTQRVVGCIMEYDGKFIILHRNPEIYEGNKYGLVAGKVEKGEKDVQSMLKEIFEETGYQAKEQELEFLGERHWHFEDKTVEFVTYKIKLKQKIEIKLYRKEHQGFLWVTPEECYARKDLIHGFHDLLEWLGLIKK